MWFTQFKKSRTDKTRPGAYYTEAIWRRERKVTFTLALGFLTQDERIAAESRLRGFGEMLQATVPLSVEPLYVEGIEGPLATTAVPGSMVFSRDEIKRAALTDTSLDAM